MEQLKLPTLSLLSPNWLIKAGYAASLILTVIAVIQYYSSAPVPSFIYALELALPTFMLGYGIKVVNYYLDWNRYHEQIKAVLNTDHYIKEPFGIATLSEARKHVQRAKTRLDKTHTVVNAIKKAELPSTDNTYIRNLLAYGNIKGSWIALSAAEERIEKRRAEIKAVLGEAKASHCLGLVLKRFPEPMKDFDIQEAKVMIVYASRLRSRAKECGIKEKDVNDDLENGDLEAVEEKIARAKKQNNLETSKNCVISTFERQISKLKGTPGYDILLEEFNELKELSYDDPDFKPCKDHLKDQILRMEINQMQTQR